MPAPSLRTYLWIAGSGFILAASLSFAAYLRFHLPWWSMVLILGGLAGLIVMALEAVVASPLEGLARGPQRGKDGALISPPAPTGRFVAAEARRLWRGMRMYQEHGAQLRSAQAGVESRVEQAECQARLLRAACATLRPEADVAALAPAMLRDLAAVLGVPAVWLVPLRRHCPVPVLGPDGEPAWGEELRASGLGPWEELLADDRALAVCLTDRAPYWRRHFAMESLWIFPLVYHKRAQGFLLARPEGAERTWTAEECALIEALTPLLAAALHPPRWSEVRRRADQAESGPLVDDSAESPAPAASWLVALAGGVADEPTPDTAGSSAATPASAGPGPAAGTPAAESAEQTPAAGDRLAEPAPEPPPTRRERRRRQRAGA